MQPLESGERLPALGLQAVRPRGLAAGAPGAAEDAARYTGYRAEAERLSSPDLAHSLSGLVHDARNVVAAMDLYCDLLDQPEVLSEPCRHYAADLRLVSGAGRRLLDKLAWTAAQSVTVSADLAPGHLSMRRSDDRPRAASVSTREGAGVEPRPFGAHPAVEGPAFGHLGVAGITRPASAVATASAVARASAVAMASAVATAKAVWPATSKAIIPERAEADLSEDTASANIKSIVEALRGMQGLLSAVAGPRVTVELSTNAGDWPIPLNSEDLTRVLLNLIRNASEAMSGAGRVQIGVEETAGLVVLSVADEGPGVPGDQLESIFLAGFTTREAALAGKGITRPRIDEAGGDAAARWPVRHRGLGLSIVRSLVSAAGGAVWASNRENTPLATHRANTARAASGKGTVIYLEFPLIEGAAAP